MQKAALTKLSVGVMYGRLKERNLTMPHRCDAMAFDLLRSQEVFSLPAKSNCAIPVRLATPSDAARICAIYNPYIADTRFTFEEEPVEIAPWQNAGPFCRFFRSNAGASKSRRFVVAETVHKQTGYEIGTSRIVEE